MKHLTVVYTTATDYYHYTMVSMISAIMAAQKDTFFDFNVIIHAEFGLQEQTDMRQILSKYSQYTLSFIDVSAYEFPDTHNKFIPRDTYYRLLLPKCLPTDRCLYLDGDTIICEDLKNIYDVDLTDAYLAGVKAMGYHWREWGSICGHSDLPDTRHYVNAGVLVMNLERIRQDGLDQRFMELMPRELSSCDQDVLNAACYDGIKFLPFRYNVMTKYQNSPVRGYYNCFSAEEIAEAWMHPAIIHYADVKKPWNIPDMHFGDRWWEVCRRDEDLWKYFHAQFLKMLPSRRGHDIIALEEFFHQHEQVYCYGAGDFGQRLALFCQVADLPLRGFVVSDGQPLPTGLILPVGCLSDLSETENIGLILAMRENSRPLIQKFLCRFSPENILSMSDSFYLELPIWTCAERQMTQVEVWKTDIHPGIILLLPDAERKTAERLVKSLTKWDRRMNFKFLVSTSGQGEANQYLSDQGICNVSLPFSYAEFYKPDYQVDNASVALWFAHNLCDSNVVAIGCAHWKIEMGRQLADILQIPHIYFDLDEKGLQSIATLVRNR